MYEKFFGLRERPFDLTPTPRFLVMTEGHREALSNLEYAIAARKGITVLLGEAGCGKTTVIRAAIERQPSRVHCVHVTNPALTRNEFVETLAGHFQLTAAARQSKATLLRELEELLRRRRDADETTVLVVDEAQSLSTELLEEIRLLANIETEEDKLLSLILAGQPELSLKLNKPSLRQFKQRIALRCELRALTMPETLAYLAGRVRAAGGVASRLFTREAATLLHEHSGGIPRIINVLADNALLSAFGKQRTQITSDLVADIARDFNIHRAAAPSTPDDAPPASPDAPPASPEPTRGDAMPSSTLLAITELPEPERVDLEPAEPEPAEMSALNTLFGTFSARRRFPFLGRRGTA